MSGPSYAQKPKPYPWQDKRDPTWPFGRQRKPVKPEKAPLPPFEPAPF
jgi:hypothetical protein